MQRNIGRCKHFVSAPLPPPASAPAPAPDSRLASVLECRV
jgi:hypothetical protein